MIFRQPTASAFGGASQPSLIGVYLLVVALLIVAHAFVVDFSRYFSSPLSLSDVAGTAIVVAAYGLLFAAAKFLLRAERDSRTVVATTLLCFVALRASWVAVFDSYQISDFGIYYRCAVEILGGTIERCTDPTYWTRGLFVAAPSLFLFGPGLHAIEIGNVIVSTITAFLVYRLAAGPGTDNGSIVAGVVAVAVFAIYPDSLYTMTLTSHDAYGLMWLAAYLLGAGHLIRTICGANRFGWIHAAMVALLLGIAMFLAEVSRSYGQLLLITSLVVAAIGMIFGIRVDGIGRRRLPLAALVFLLVIPVATSWSLNSAYRNWNADALAGNTAGGLLASLTAADTRLANRLEDLRFWREHQYPLLKERGDNGYAIAKLINEWGRSFGLSIGHVARKNEVLSLGSGNFGFSFGDHERPSWDPTRDEVGRTNHAAWQIQDSAIRLLNLLMYVALAARLLLLRRVPLSTNETLVWTFSAISYLMILGLLETQPRYDVFLVLPYATSAGVLLSFFLRPKSERGAEPNTALPSRRTLTWAIALVPLTVFAAWVPLWGAVKLGLGLSDMSAASKLDAAQVAAMLPGHTMGAFSLTTRSDGLEIELPADAESRDVSGVTIPLIAARDGANRVEFFVNPATTEHGISLTRQVCVFFGTVGGCRDTGELRSMLISETVQGYAKGDDIPVTVIFVPAASATASLAEVAKPASVEYARVL